MTDRPMTKDETEIAWREQFLDDMQKIGIKSYNRASHAPQHLPVSKYDPYKELEK